MNQNLKHIIEKMFFHLLMIFISNQKLKNLLQKDQINIVMLFNYNIYDQKFKYMKADYTLELKQNYVDINKMEKAFKEMLLMLNIEIGDKFDMVLQHNELNNPISTGLLT